MSQHEPAPASTSEHASAPVEPARASTSQHRVGATGACGSVRLPSLASLKSSHTCGREGLHPIIICIILLTVCQTRRDYWCYPLLGASARAVPAAGNTMSHSGQTHGTDGHSGGQSKHTAKTRGPGVCVCVCVAGMASRHTYTTHTRHTHKRTTHTHTHTHTHTQRRTQKCTRMWTCDVHAPS